LTRSHHAFTLIEVMSSSRYQWIMLAEVPI